MFGYYPGFFLGFPRNTRSIMASFAANLYWTPDVIYKLTANEIFFWLDAFEEYSDERQQDSSND